MSSLTNVTAKFSIGKKVNLKKLQKSIEGSDLTKRAKSAFHRVKIRLESPKCTVLVYGNGKVILQGMRGTENIQKVADELSGLFNMPSPECSIVNMAGQGSFGFEVNLDDLHEAIRKTSFIYLIYAPDDWHGLRVKLPEGTAIVFKSGNIKLTGVTSKTDFENLFTRIKFLAQLSLKVDSTIN